MNVPHELVLIDDDAMNNRLCRRIIEKTYPEAHIADFLHAQDGLNYIEKTYEKNDGASSVILLLDIMMPIMNAWDFLEQYEQLNEKVKNQIAIYILSSSVDKADIARAESNKNVQHYLVKPLTRDTIKAIEHGPNYRTGGQA